MPRRVSAMSEPLPLFVDPEALRRAVGEPDIQIVAVDGPDEFAGGHLPGARRLAMTDFMASNPPAGGLLPSEDALHRLFSGIGLRNDARIVAYDRAGDGQAARLLYTLDAMDHDRIALLDGGLAAWRAAGFELETGDPTYTAGDFTVRRRADRIADRQWIETRLDDRRVAALDVRSVAEYVGEDVRSARGGHIPGAVNIDWEDLKDGRGRLRARGELERIFAGHGLRDAEDIVAYCQTHVRSSYVYLVLKHLGFTQVRGYPGAWSEWGNTDDTPIVSGPTPRG